MNNATRILVVTGMLATLTAASSADTGSSNPKHWMVGTWDCSTGYHENSRVNTLQHSMTGVYTIVEDSPDGLVHGEYRETDDGHFGPTDYDDTWLITDRPFPNNDPWVITGYEAHGVGGRDFQIRGDGELRGPIAGSTFLGGSSIGAFAGQGRTATVVLPGPIGGGSVTRGWSGGYSAGILDDDVVMFRNWTVQAGPTSGTFQLYIDALCMRRP